MSAVSASVATCIIMYSTIIIVVKCIVFDVSLFCHAVVTSWYVMLTGKGI